MSSAFVRYHNELAELMSIHKGEILQCQEIHAIFKKNFPDYDKKYLQPSDHCVDHTNKAPCHCSTKITAIFSRIQRGVYRVI
ncbi:MAG: hypothetical protein UT63_C0051G0003 [Candidatus Gottesmanbacteria bacterium GW2011_GWC2_39_8]|uniref:Uncharacterized protein n=1 Tax=Candidatus Gottesmanbacteria bacterium GW2011_GWC2_39_8 TaxID=1618450 RepID=A0A0G0Q429_9BACT|nr:MAG: hypothetical protein UT63_C0051G0003 [Candidatus Gottesmanbacteria bacterium GW2011_GWC2_39_8]